MVKVEKVVEVAESQDESIFIGKKEKYPRTFIVWATELLGFLPKYRPGPNGLL